MVVSMHTDLNTHHIDARTRQSQDAYNTAQLVLSHIMLKNEIGQ